MLAKLQAWKRRTYATLRKSESMTPLNANTIQMYIVHEKCATFEPLSIAAYLSLGTSQAVFSLSSMMVGHSAKADQYVTSEGFLVGSTYGC